MEPVSFPPISSNVSKTSDRCPRAMFAVERKQIITLISSRYLSSGLTGYSDRWILLFLSLLLLTRCQYIRDNKILNEIYIYIYERAIVFLNRIYKKKIDSSNNINCHLLRKKYKISKEI